MIDKRASRTGKRNHQASGGPESGQEAAIGFQQNLGEVVQRGAVYIAF